MSAAELSERLLNAIRAPHLSEKALNLAESGGRKQLAFRVATTATKPEIAEAVRQIFDVQVDSVAVINCKGKRKRRGGSMGRRAAWKKAYVTLAAGQDLDFVAGE
ncbi:50S ribosomal protein L23 [Candidatus Foliamicus sp.]